MGDFSSTDWNRATFVLFAYGCGLIMVAAATWGVLFTRGSTGVSDDGPEATAPPRFDHALASWPRRFASLVTDALLIAALSAPFALFLHPMIGAAVMVFTATIYFPMGYGAGNTLGTVLTRIRIVNSDGAEPGLSRGTLRNLMFFATMLPVGGGKTAGLRGPGGVSYNRVTMQGGHDRIAGTYVVRI